MKTQNLAALSMGLLLGGAAVVRADEPPKDDPNKFVFHISGTAFGGKTEGNYGSGSLSYKISPNWKIKFAGTSGRNGSKTIGNQTVSFGGKEGEISAIYHEDSSALDLGLGVLFPTTASQDVAVLTYSVSRDLSPWVKGLRLEVLGLAGSGKPVGGLKGSYELPLSTRTFLDLDATEVFSGNSTISLNTGKPIRSFLGGAKIGYRITPNQSFQVGISNILGETTGMSLASPVGNNWGVVLGYGVKF